MSVYGGYMRRDAYRRSRQMYGGAPAEPSSAASESVPPDMPPAPEPRTERISRSGVRGPGGLLGGLLPDGIDSDTLLIAALLLLLLKEGGDIKLLLALGYILL